MNDHTEPYRDARDEPLVRLDRAAAGNDRERAVHEADGQPGSNDDIEARGTGRDSHATGSMGERSRVDAEAPLFSNEESSQLRDRWESVQASFVDEPRRAVEEADGLVRQVMDRLSDGFANQRERLEREWDSHDETSTEDLRMALRHYRSFFDRLLRL